MGRRSAGQRRDEHGSLAGLCADLGQAPSAETIDEGWAAVNIAAGLTGSLTSEGQLRYFHQGNAAWNSVNLVLGVVGLVDQLRARRRVVDLATGLRAARRARLVFLVNGALDVAYIGAGAVMWQLAFGRSDRFTGYGQALVLQGAFLFGFDFAMAFAHERRLRPHERP